MDRMLLAAMDAVEQAALVASGAASPAELVAAALERAAAVEPQIHAIAALDAEGAKQRAMAVSGPLAGVPFLVKDVLPYPGLPCRFGSRLFAQPVFGPHSPYSERLAAAGLLAIGTSTSSEFGLLGSTETLLYGATHNPWDLRRSAAGSSGGAAAAVAAGIVPLAHASDAGGSIRLPAAVCGVFGFKPSRGRCVPGGPAGSRFAALVVDHCISRSVRDSARLLSLTEAHGAEAAFQPIGYVQQPLDRPLRIGVWCSTVHGEAPDPEVAGALSGTIALCRQLGHSVVAAASPALNAAALSDAFFSVAGAAMSELVGTVETAMGQPVAPDQLEPFTRSLIAWYRDGGGVPSDGADAAFAEAAACYHSALEPFDVLLTPTTPSVAWPLGTLAPTLDRETLFRRTERIAGYTAIHNIGGCPAMSVPLWWSAAGLPIGSQFAARPGDDALLVRLAYQLETAAPWCDRWAPHSFPRLAGR